MDRERLVRFPTRGESPALFRTRGELPVLPRLLPALLLLALTGCRARIEYTTPIPDDGTFPRVAPSADALERYRRAADFSRDHDGLSVMVLEHNQVVFEEYQNDNTPEVPHHLYSGTKSFSCAMAVAALEDGLITLDEPVADTLTELEADDRKSRITVRELLQFTSGLDQDRWHLTRDGLFVHQRVEDKYQYALGLEAVDEPGTRYVYGSSHLTVFGAFMKRKLGEDPLRYLERRVLTPLGLRYAGWIRDPAGNPMLPYGAWTTANEWAKFGVLIKDRGVWKGQQLLPAELLETCFQGSAVMPGYGLAFWLNAPVSQTDVDAADSPVKEPDGPDGLIDSGGPSDLVMAAGYNDNRLYIIPSRDLVIVRLGDGDRGWNDGDFLRLLLEP
jgi:CubicO group peptidase (beta-lactamase class C family)